MSEIILSEYGVMPSETESLINTFIESQDIKQNSKATYKGALKQFMLWIEDNSIKKPIREDILKYKGFLQQKGIASLTISNYIAAIRKFFEWSEGVGLYPNVAKNVKGMKKPKGFLRDPLNEDQIKGILNDIDTCPIYGKRNYAIINLMVRTGLRTKEIVSCNVGDIRQYDNERILYIHGKGRDSKDEFVILTTNSLAPINEYIIERGKVGNEDPLFISHSDRSNGKRLSTRTVRDVVKTHLRGIGLNSNRLSAHSLRHTFATIAIKNGASILGLKDSLRHSSLETTMKYTHTIDRIKNGAERYIEF